MYNYLLSITPPDKPYSISDGTFLVMFKKTERTLEIEKV